MEITLNVTLLTALLALLLTGSVFLVALLAFLLRGVSAMLRTNIEPLKDNFNTKIELLKDNFNTKIELLKDNQVRIEKRMDSMESEIKSVQIKLDQILSAQAKG